MGTVPVQIALLIYIIHGLINFLPTPPQLRQLIDFVRSIDTVHQDCYVIHRCIVVHLCT